MDRRKFIKNTCLTCAALAIGLSIESCVNGNKVNPTTVNFTIDLSSPSSATLKTVGGYVYQNNVYVFRAAGNSYIAFSDSCTHAGCAVAYNSGSSQFVCPCHNGVFDSNGNVVSGPPNSPLVKYTTSVSGTILTVKS